MGGCCENVCASEALQGKQRGTLRSVLVINAIMFLVIVIASQMSKSSALLADSLDNLGDAMTYGLSLIVGYNPLAPSEYKALIPASLRLVYVPVEVHVCPDQELTV